MTSYLYAARPKGRISETHYVFCVNGIKVRLALARSLQIGHGVAHVLTELPCPLETCLHRVELVLATSPTGYS